MAFKMKGHTLPGIKQKSEGNTDLKDGRSGSAAFQQKSPLEQITKEEAKKKALEELNRIHAAQFDAEERGDIMAEEILYAKGREKLEEGRKLYGEGGLKYKSAFQHRVDDVPSHQDEYGEEHYEDLQTDEEHKNGTRTHFPDGTKRSEREIAEYDENKAEEEKEKPAKNK